MPPHPVSPALIRVRVGLVIAAAFFAAMAAFFIIHDPYRDVGRDIAGSGDFEQSVLSDSGLGSSGYWQGRGESLQWEPHGGFDSSGGVRLGTRAGRGSSLVFTFDDPRRFKFLRLAGRLRTEGIVVGDQPWDSARLLLVFTDRNGRRHWEYHPEVCKIVGTKQWRLCEGVFEVPDFAVSAEVVAENKAASGTLWVDDVRLTPAVEKPSRPFWRALFATLWCGVLVYCIWLAKLPRKVLGVAAIGVALVIIAGVAVPESAVERILNRGAYVAKALVKGQVLSLYPSAVQTVRSPDSPHLGPPAFVPPRPLRPDAVFAAKKMGHFLLFGLLAFVTFYSAALQRPGPSAAASPVADLPTLILALLVFAAATEVLQFLSSTRGPSLVDWIIDAGGILVGAWVALLVRRFADRAVPSDSVF